MQWREVPDGLWQRAPLSRRPQVEGQRQALALSYTSEPAAVQQEPCSELRLGNTRS